MGKPGDSFSMGFPVGLQLYKAGLCGVDKDGFQGRIDYSILL